jgi:hypothetical protein
MVYAADGGRAMIDSGPVTSQRFVPDRVECRNHRPSLDAPLVGGGGGGLALRRYAEGSTPGGFIDAIPVRTVPYRCGSYSTAGDGTEGA